MRTRVAVVSAAASVLVGMAAGAAVFAPGGAAAGPVSAAQVAAHPGVKGDQLAAAAKAIGISEADLRAALRDGKTIAAVAQEHGVAVDKVIDAMVAAAQPGLRERITDVVNGEHKGPGFKHRLKHGLKHLVREELAVAAKAIGISEEDLRAALRDGKSIAAVAKEHGVAASKVVDALVADVKARLAEKVQAGALTQAQADEISARLTGKITALVNNSRPQRGFRR